MTQWSRLPRQWHALAAGNPDSVLLETSRFDPSNTRSLLFLHPVRVLSASALDQIPELFRQVEEALAAGLYVAGFVGYECGYHFQPVGDAVLAPAELPLAWFGVYRGPLIYNHCEGREGAEDEPSPPSDGEAATMPDDIALALSEEEYCAKIRRIQDYILAGDTYQVNFTDQVDVHTPESATEAFTELSRQPVAYSALVHAAGHHILSFSPELFFRIDGGKIVTRPMKGTMPRGLDSAEDAEAATRLKNDEKNRSEHVMIVDLLRNDLGRICAMGSVRVEDIFSVEKYRTLLQMTSTVSGTLRPELGYYEIFRSMFPGGSITGAPKIRTMQIIREMEERPRGVYTGAIGFISPQRSSVFNVAIRTIVRKNGRARMGVGGGIVADSRPAEEYRECLLKASFLIRPRPEFQLLETMLWDGEFAFLSMHLDRMESSAAYFEFSFDRPAAAAQLIERAKRFPPGERYRVRMLLDSAGQVTVAAARHLPGPPAVSVRLSPERTSSADVFLRHKTTRRERYDRLYQQARAEGFDEIIFLNERDEVTEGAVSNVFIQRQGRLLTPPLRCGVLPGVFRRHLLESDAAAEECVLTVRDLASADRVFLCNSIRGMRQVKPLSFEGKKG